MPAALFSVLLLLSLAAMPMVLALPQLPRPAPRDGPQQDSARVAAVVEDRLFLHRHAQWTPSLLLNTTPTTNRQEAAVTGGGIEFTSQVPLGSEISIAGKDDRSGGSGKGIWLNFLLSGVLFNSDVTITILQDDTVVANGTTTLSAVATRTEWSVPFTNGELDHTFPSGALIKLRIACSRPATMTYNTTDSYILLPLMSNPVLPQMATSYANGKITTEFHPYWSDAVRHIRVEGDIVTAFGTDDIKSVTVQIRSPSGDEAANGSVQRLWGGHYIFWWNYSKGQLPGNYNVTVKVLDRQDHAYPVTTIVTMLRHAVYISSPQQDTDDVAKGAASPSKGGSEGKSAAYSLIVLNSGYAATTVTMRVSSEPPKGWSATLSTTALASLEPGATANVTFTVVPDSSIMYGSRAIIYVEGVADADTRVPKASWTLQTVTNATMSRALDFSLNGPSEVALDLDQTATYEMLARNRGVLDMNVSFAVSGTPLGWSARLDVSGLVHLDTGANSERILRLSVTAPSEEVANLSRVAQLTVTAQVQEDSSLEKRVNTVTRLITILGLSVDKTVQTCDPGGQVSFRATISNMDPMLSHPVRITVALPSEWPASAVTFTPRETILGPNTTTTITLTVAPPAAAEANLDSGYTLTIKVEPTDQPTRSNSTNIVVKLREKVEFSMEIAPSSRDATPGEKVALRLTLKNTGNSDVIVVVFVAADIPQDWKVHLNDGKTDVLSPPNPLSVQLAPAGRAGATQTVNLTVQPSKSTRSDTTVKITITATAGADVKTTSSASITVKKDLLARLYDAVLDSLLVIIFCVLVLVVFGVLLRRNARPARR